MAKDVFEHLPMQVRDRFSWVKVSGYQVTAIAALLKAQLKEIDITPNDKEAVALSLLLTRLSELGDAISDLGDSDQEYSGEMEEALTLEFP